VVGILVVEVVVHSLVVETVYVIMAPILLVQPILNVKVEKFVIFLIILITFVVWVQKVGCVQQMQIVMEQEKHVAEELV
jgi:hypothetical protein